jgi:hypothetical protein
MLSVRTTPHQLLHALHRRHALFEVMLRDEYARPYPDRDLVSRLKRAKLGIKDRMALLNRAAGLPPAIAAA